MHLHIKKFLSFIFLLLADVITLWACVFLVYKFRLIIDHLFANSIKDSVEMYTNFPVYYLVVVLSFIYQGVYHRHFDFWEEIKRIYKGLIVGMLAVFTWLALTKQSEEYSRFILFFTFVVLFLIVPVVKRLLKYILTSTGLWIKFVQIVGKNEDVQILKKEIAKNWYLGMKNMQNAPSVIIVSKGHSYEALLKVSEHYLLKSKEVLFVPTLNHINFSDTEIVELHNLRISLIEVRNRLKEPFAIFLKTILDMIVSFFLLPFLFILLCVIGLLIKIDSRSSIFFKQKRLGKNGSVFYCYKFTTMHDNASEILEKYLSDNPEEIQHYKLYHKYKHDPRVTRIGKWLRRTSLDELPQIINIVQGKMSFIGPRPYMIEERHKLKKSIEELLLVKPGISGLWQVSGRSELTFEQRVDLDKWYVRNWTLWLDMIILAKTLKVVVIGKGAK